MSRRLCADGLACARAARSSECSEATDLEHAIVTFGLSHLCDPDPDHDRHTIPRTTRASEHRLVITSPMTITSSTSVTMRVSSVILVLAAVCAPGVSFTTVSLGTSMRTRHGDHTTTTRGQMRSRAGRMGAATTTESESVTTAATR